MSNNEMVPTMKAVAGSKPTLAKQGDLCVWHNPQVGAVDSFYFPVPDVESAKVVLNLLADYDLWQFENNIKGDYASASGLMQYEVSNNGDFDNWVEWTTEEGYDISEVMRGLAVGSAE